jgi:uncharacterized protein YcbX
MTNKLHLSAIYVYPIKSLGGIRVETATVEARGLAYDRRWMLVDEHNTFLTQRQYPQMALLRVEIRPEGLRVFTSGKPDLLVPYKPQTTEELRVTVWDDTCMAIAVSAEADRWFSEATGFPCRLVYMPQRSIRPVDERYARGDDHVSFADAYPFLLIGEASLNDLNARLAEPVPMNRFRPNFVVSGAEPFAEDGWHGLRIGNSLFYAVKPCARCVLITIDQTTAARGREPLQTLAGYRSANNKVYFGQNLLYGGEGTQVQAGDFVQVVSRRESVLLRS